MTKFYFALLFVLVISMPAWGQEAEGSRERPMPMVQVKVNWWQADFSGEILWEEESQSGLPIFIVGDRLDFNDDLGIEEREDVWEPEIVLHFNRNYSITVGYYSVEYDGEETLKNSTEFGGYIFLPNTKLETDLGIDRLLLITDLHIASDAGSLGLMLGAEYFLSEIEIEGTALLEGKVDDDESISLIIPLAGISGAIYLPYGFGLNADFSGMAIAYGDYKASYTKLNGGLTFDYRYLRLGVGYRWNNVIIDLDDEDDDELKIKYDVDHQGWVFTAGINLGEMRAL